MKNEKTIKQILKELFLASKREIFTDASLQDGSIIRTDDDMLKVGSKVTLVSQDGTATPVADGSYTLEDGSILVVKSGVIDSITPAAAGTDAPAPADTTGANPTSDEPASMDAVPTPVDGITPEQDAEQPAPSAPAADSDDVSQLIEIIKNLTDRVSALEEKVAGTKMAVEKMSAAPAAKPFNEAAKPLSAIEFLAKFNAEKRAKTDKNKTNVEEVSKSITKETPIVFSKANAPKEAAKPVVWDMKLKF